MALSQNGISAMVSAINAFPVGSDGFTRLSTYINVQGTEVFGQALSDSLNGTLGLGDFAPAEGEVTSLDPSVDPFLEAAVAGIEASLLGTSTLEVKRSDSGAIDALHIDINGELGGGVLVLSADQLRHIVQQSGIVPEGWYEGNTSDEAVAVPA